MTPPSSPNLDLVSVAVALLGVLLSREVAQIVGPYVVIFFGAILGASFAASRRPQTTRSRLLGFMATVVGLTLVITVPCAQIIAAWYPEAEVRWTLGPVAILIGGIGSDWPKVAAWFLGLVRTVVERWASTTEPRRPDNSNGG